MSKSVTLRIFTPCKEIVGNRETGDTWEVDGAKEHCETLTRSELIGLVLNNFKLEDHVDSVDYINEQGAAWINLVSTNENFCSAAFLSGCEKTYLDVMKIRLKGSLNGEYELNYEDAVAAMLV